MSPGQSHDEVFLVGHFVLAVPPPTPPPKKKKKKKKKIGAGQYYKMPEDGLFWASVESGGSSVTSFRFMLQKLGFIANFDSEN